MGLGKAMAPFFARAGNSPWVSSGAQCVQVPVVAHGGGLRVRAFPRHCCEQWAKPPTGSASHRADRPGVHLLRTMGETSDFGQQQEAKAWITKDEKESISDTLEGDSYDGQSDEERQLPQQRMKTVYIG